MQYPLERFLVERPRPGAMPEAMGCMDDRPNALRVLWWQLGGGPDGLARGYATAKEMQRPNGYIKDGRPIHRLGLALRKTLEENGTIAFMHWVCAAYMGAEAVDRTIVEKPDEVFARTKLIDPHMTEERFERVRDAKWRLLDSGLIVAAEKSDHELQYGIDEQRLRPMPFLHLMGEHVANDIVVDYGNDALWDTRAAYAAQLPAYFIGLGILRDVHKAIAPSSPLEVQVDDLADTEKVRHASISMHLPTGPRGEFNFHIRTAT